MTDITNVAASIGSRTSSVSVPAPPDTLAALQTRFGDAIQDTVRFRGELTVLVQRQSIAEVCRFCHDELGFDFLSDLTAVDWLDRSPRFDVVYHLTSMQHFTRLRLKVQAELDVPVPTVSTIWAAANWPEREVYDLFGIEFEGHPDLRRLLLPEGWVGFPLRKDSPQSRISLPRPKSDKVPPTNN